MFSTIAFRYSYYQLFFNDDKMKLHDVEVPVIWMLGLMAHRMCLRILTYWYLCDNTVTSPMSMFT